MAKQQARSRTTSATRKGTLPNKKPLIPEKYQGYLYCGLLILSIIVFFQEAIFSGSFQTSDNVAAQSFLPFLDKAEADGEFAEWMPYIFSGFPGYPAQLMTGERWWDVIGNIFFGTTLWLEDVLNSDAARVSIFYMLYAVGMYLLMRQWKQERFAAFFTAFAAVFTTLVITWIMIGHNTKPIMIMTFPFLILCLENLRHKFSWLYAGLLGLTVHILFEPGAMHHQVAYYGLMMLAIYFIYHLVVALRDKTQMRGWTRAILLTTLAGGIAFGMAADRFLSNLEYQPYSTRGTAPLVNILQAGDNVEEVEERGDREYATSYSFDPAEIRAWFVPNYYGFGRLTYEGPEVPRAMQLNTYFGSKPISDAAIYWGIGVLFLAVFGAVWYWREKRVRFLVIMCGIALLTSFGSHFSLLYDLFYYFLPGFKIFRAPETILVLFSFGLAILAGHGVAGVMQAMRDHKLGAVRSKHLLYGLGFAAAFLALGVIYPSVFGDAYRASAGEVLMPRGYPQSIVDFVYDSMMKDWYVTAALALAFMLVSLLAVRGKLKMGLYIPLMLVLLVFDLWRVDYRPMEVAEQRMEASIQQSDVEQFLMKDEDLFRIAEFKRQNQTAYFFLQNIHGYSSAKLRIYQDLMDIAGTPAQPGQAPELRTGNSFITNPFLWDLLNVKYIVFPQQIPGQRELFQSAQTGEFVYRNQTQLPRAFFVDSVAIAKQEEILFAIRDAAFDPLSVAYLEEALPDGQKIDPTGPAAKAEVTKFGNHEIDVKVTATGNNLLFLSEVFYPVAWHAYIDGKEIPIHKTNFAFRSVVVPPGEHTIEFRYEARRSWIKYLEFALNLLVLGGLIFGIYTAVNERKNAQAKD